MSNLRDQTLNRLNNVSFCIPNAPIPSPVMPLSVFEEMMYKVAYENGYSETKTDFLNDFVRSLIETEDKTVSFLYKGFLSTFPSIGEDNMLYIDIEKNDIYYWKDDQYYKITTSNQEISEGIILDGGNSATL